MTVEVTFEYHSTSTDNEAGVASGWRDPPLSDKGREQAKELGERRQGDQIDAVFCSDLRRAVETAEIAFPDLAIRPDPRLREYDYGSMTGSPPELIHAERPSRVNTPFPEGESLHDVVNRVRSFIDELARDWDGKASCHHRPRSDEARARPYTWRHGARGRGLPAFQVGTNSASLAVFSPSTS